MPDNDGVYLATQILKNRPQIKVIMMSGYIEFNDEKIKAFCDSHLKIHKPFSSQELLVTLQKNLSNKTPENNLYLSNI